MQIHQFFLGDQEVAWIRRSAEGYEATIRPDPNSLHIKTFPKPEQAYEYASQVHHDRVLTV